MDEWRLPRKALLGQSALVILGALIPLAAVFLHGAGPEAEAASIQVMSSLATVGAGVALLGCWKIGGRAAPGWLGVGLIDLGVLTMLYHNLSGLASSPLWLVEPFGRLVLCIVVVGCFSGALCSPEVDDRLRPLTVLAVTCLLGFGGLAVFNWILPESLSFEQNAALVQGTLIACGLLWLGLGVFATATRRPGTLGWIGWFILLRLLGSAAGALLAEDAWGQVVMQTAYLASAAVSLVACAWELRHTVTGQDRYAFDLRTVLHATRADIERERGELDERLHDLRNAVAGMRCADSTLRTYSSRLDDETRAKLSEALSSELSRLQTLIEPGRELRSDEFCLSEALTPVLFTERSRGSLIDAHIDPVRVTGDRDAVAQVAQNLLTNARLYAAGSPVTISAEQIVDRVLLRISDNGPGIPEQEHSAIFERGARGSTSLGTKGSGIGLHVAARLMREMGGSLHLVEAVAGASFVVELPAAGSPPGLAGEAPVERPAVLRGNAEPVLLSHRGPSMGSRN